MRAASGAATGRRRNARRMTYWARIIGHHTTSPSKLPSARWSARNRSIARAVQRSMSSGLDTALRREPADCVLRSTAVTGSGDTLRLVGCMALGRLRIQMLLPAPRDQFLEQGDRWVEFDGRHTAGYLVGFLLSLDRNAILAQERIDQEAIGGFEER